QPLRPSASPPSSPTSTPFFFQAEDGIRDFHVTGVQTCALPILVKEGFLSNEDLSSAPEFDDQKVEFDKVSRYKVEILEKAYTSFMQREKQHIVPFVKFCEENENWLD